MDKREKESILSSAMRHAETTKELISEAGAIRALSAALKRHFSANSFTLVADENTWEVAGKQVETLLRDADLAIADIHIFPGKPMLEADYLYSVMLSQRFLKIADAIPIAIGSGTINDIVKLASHMGERPYVCVATASSVDGYASDGAAMLTEGAKMTHPCPAPTIIIGDDEIMATAPALLTASGYADLMAKVPAGADWIVADHLGEAPIDAISWELVQSRLRSYLSDPSDTGAIFMGLTLCGIAMQHQKDSRPVSGAEHLLSHVWEMEHLTHEGEAPLHGIKVGIGSLMITSVYELLFSTDGTDGDALLSHEKMLTQKIDLLTEYFAAFGNIPLMKKTLLAKYADPSRQAARRAILIQDWALLKERVGAQLYRYEEMEELLKRAGCATTFAEIGLDPLRGYGTLKKAQLIRNRYTVMDVLDDLGLMDQTIASLVTQSVR